MPTNRRMSRGCGARHRDGRGAVAVEFALIFPLLVMLLLGITTAGLSFSHAIGVTNAVREGSRFGATADASAASWSSDVISRVRTTQFDDAGATTEICVQLWQKGNPTPLAQSCDGSVAGVELPANETDAPAVPADLAPGACVVRVIAGRPFTINIGVVVWDEVNVDYAVARYERRDEVPACA